MASMIASPVRQVQKFRPGAHDAQRFFAVAERRVGMPDELAIANPCRRACRDRAGRIQ